MTQIDELTTYEFNVLNSMANNQAAKAVAVLMPMDTDSTDKYNKFKEELDQVDHMIRLGLIEDISEEFKATLEQVRNQHSRDIKMIGLTELGQLMFENINKKLKKDRLN